MSAENKGDFVSEYEAKRAKEISDDREFRKSLEALCDERQRKSDEAFMAAQQMHETGNNERHESWLKTIERSISASERQAVALERIAAALEFEKANR